MLDKFIKHYLSKNTNQNQNIINKKNIVLLYFNIRNCFI